MAKKTRPITGSEPMRAATLIGTLLSRATPGRPTLDRAGSTCSHLAAMLLFMYLFVGARTLSAQSIWEVTPYHVDCWVTLAKDATVPTEWQTTLPEQLERTVGAKMGAVWQFHALATPTPYYVDLLRQHAYTLDELAEQTPQVRTLDKLMVATVSADRGGYRIRVQQLDMRAREWTVATEQQVGRGSEIVDAILDLVCQHFSPIVHIDRVEEASVMASGQATALIRPRSSVRAWRTPVEFEVGDVLLPFVRKADRNGIVGASGVQPVEWTLLTIEEKINSGYRCSFESGYRQPFRLRRSSRLDQLAMRARPNLNTTTIELVDRKNPEQSLAGYEIYEKEGEGEGEKTVLLGRTNWQGQLEIARKPEQPIRVLFVRNGQQLLGKLPIIVGERSRIVAPLRNDDVRLEAEGFLIGVQDSLVDLVARREVLANRVRKAIEAQELEKATALLKELRQLDTQDDFARRVQERKRSLSSADTQVQQKIDQLFAQTRTLLGRYLSQEQVDQLAASLQAASAAGSN